MPIYRGGLTGLAGAIGGAQDEGGRLVSEIMGSYERNRLLNKEQVEEDRRLAKEQREQKYKALDITMDFYKQAIISKDPKVRMDGVKLYNENAIPLIKEVFGINLSQIGNITDKEVMDFGEMEKIVNDKTARTRFLVNVKETNPEHYDTIKGFFDSHDADVKEGEKKEEAASKEEAIASEKEAKLRAGELALSPLTPLTDYGRDVNLLKSGMSMEKILERKIPRKYEPTTLKEAIELKDVKGEKDTGTNAKKIYDEYVMDELERKGISPMEIKTWKKAGTFAMAVARNGIKSFEDWQKKQLDLDGFSDNEKNNKSLITTPKQAQEAEKKAIKSNAFDYILNID